MRTSMLDAVSETVQGLVNIGLPVTFTKMSQNVFAKALNVSTHAVRQWEQGKRPPTGPTKVLLELLEIDPHLLDYRLS